MVQGEHAGMLKRNITLLAYLLFFAAVSIIYGCGGGTEGDGNWSASSDKMTITGKVSGDLAAVSSASALLPLAAVNESGKAGDAQLTGRAASKFPKVYLKDNDKKSLIDSAAPSDDGTFSFYGDFRGLLLSFYIGSASNEILLGRVDPGMPLRSQINVSLPYNASGGFDGNAVIASNIIKSQGLTSEIFVTSSGIPNLWSIIDKTKAAVSSYLAANPGKITADVLKESGDPASPSIVEIISKMDLPKPPAAVLDHFEVSPVSASVTAGDTITVTIRARGENNSLLTGFNGIASISSTTGAGTFSPVETPRFLAGECPAVNMSILKSQPKVRITFSSGGKYGYTNEFDVTPGAISSYSAAVGPAQEANQGFSGTVTAFDKFGNIADNDSSTLIYISSNVSTDSVIFYSDASYSQAVSMPYKYKLNKGIAAFFMKSSKTQQITLDFYDNSNIKVTSPVISVGTRSVSSYEMSVGTAQLAGNGFQGVITARDSRGDIASADNLSSFTFATTASTESVAFFSDASYTLEMPSRPTYKMESGVLKFFVKSKIPQSFVILATVDPDKTVSSALITAGQTMASSYEMEVAAEQTAGVEFMGLITAKDSLGRVIDTDNSTNITLTVTGGPGLLFYSDNTYSTPLQQPVRYILGSGSAFFYARSESSQVINIISVDDFGRTVKSPDIIINPAQTVRYSLTVNGLPTVEGFSGTIKALDAYGNIVTADNSGMIKLSVLSGTASGIYFYADPSFSSKFNENSRYLLNSGRADFYVRNDRVESMSLRAEDAFGKTGDSDLFAVNYGPFDHFEISADSPQAAGLPVTMIVKAMDRAGNAVRDFNSSGTLKIDSPSGFITWSGPGVAAEAGSAGLYNGKTAFLNGLASIAVTNSRAEQSKKVTITDTATGKSASVDASWISGSFHHFSISGIPGQCVAGTTVAVEIKALDSNGNIDSAFNNVSSSMSDSTGTLSPAVTGLFAAGVWTGEITFTKAADINHLTVTASSKNSVSGAFKVKHSSITGYAVNASSPQVAGVGASNTIVARDAYGNTVNSDSSTIVNISSDALLASFYTGADYNATTASCKLLSGVATYYFKDTRSEKFKISVYDSFGNKGVSPEITVNPATISSYTLTAVSSNTAGIGFSGTITAKDPYGNIAINDNSTIVNMSNTGTGVTFYTSGNYVAPALSYHLNSGVASYFVRDTRDETFEIRVTDGNLKSGKSSVIKIDHGPTSHYQVASISPQAAGSGFTNIITAKDAFNNTVLADSTTTVNIASTASALAFYTNAGYNGATSGYRLNAGVAYYFARDTKSELVNIAVSDSNGKTGVSSDIYVTPAPISNYIVGSFTPKIAGNGFSGTITAKDAFNNTVITDSATTVDMTTSGHGVTFYSDAAYLTPVSSYRLTAGVTPYFVKNTVAENFDITARDSNLKIGLSNPITINPGPLASYSLTAVSPQTAGVGNPATITAKDAYNNTVTDSSMLVNLTSNGTGVTFYTDPSYLTTSTFFTLSSGVATYYVKNTKAEIYKITAADANGKTGVSGNMTILPGDIANYVIASDSPHAANEGFSNTITAYDAFGNIAVNDNTTDAVMGSSGTGVSFYTDSSYAFVTGFYRLAAGRATYFVKNNKSETFTITVTDQTGKTGSSSPISMLPGAVSKYKVGILTPQVAGVGFTVTIYAQDDSGNTVIADSTTSVSVSSTGTAVNFYTDAAYSIPGNNYTLTAGVATCYLKNTKAESFTVSAGDGSGHTGVSPPIAINHAQISSYSVLPVPNKEAGSVFANTVMALDVYGNPAVNDFTTVINMTTTGTGLNFYTDNFKTATTTTYQLNAGSVIYYAVNTKAEIFTITATDNLLKTGTSSNISVYPAPVVSYQITPPAASPGAGTNFTGVINGIDTYGNLVVNDSVTSFNITSVPAGVSFYQSDFITAAGSYVLTSGTVNYYAKSNVASNVIISITDFFGRSGLSPSFTIKPGAINSYTVDSSSPQVAGLGFVNTIRAKDIFGNTVTTDSSTVVGVSAAGGTGVTFYADGTYAAPAISYTLNSGIATYFVKNTAAETFAVSALDGSGNSGLSNNITVDPGAIASYAVLSTSPMSVAGGGISNAIIAKDAYNNTVTNASGTIVTVSSSSPAAGALFYDPTYSAVTGNYTLSSGQATYYLKVTNPAETFTVDVTDTNLKTGSSAVITTVP